MEKKQPNEAMFFLKVALFLHPQEYRVLYSLGEIYYDKKLYHAAIDKVKIATEINPRLTKGLLLLGKAYFQTKQYNLALQALERASALDPKNQETLRSLENIRKKYAVDQIAKAAESYSKNDIPQAKVDLQKAFEASDNVVFNLFVIENESAKEQDVQQHIDKLNVLSKVDPERFSKYLLIANMLMENHDFERAIDFYLKCLDKEPLNVILHNNLAVAFFQVKKFEEAIREYRIALSFEPDNVNTIYGLARCYQETNLLQEAKKLYEYLFQLPSGMSCVYLSLANIYQQENSLALAKQMLTKAIDLSEQQLQVDGENVLAGLTLKKANEELRLLDTPFSPGIKSPSEISVQ